ncbi:hypothetical protein IX308_000426 [Porphyromonas levii]|uniref:hypothetical protein n=1 Tax=Porphyromonas levii TaxID=28114 RepID=UPI001BAAA22F|nr:hypothetical protein [Porphyromonas levii]MBR8784257.1 hypothetical protein [Porphyromonas levii]
MAKKALSVSQVLAQKKETFSLSPEWRDMIGVPEACGTWIVWGKSGNGKSSFVMKLAKELCRFDTVLFNSLEEGVGLTMMNTLERFGMMESNGRLRFVSESMEALAERLEKRRSPRIVIVDSFQYTGMSYRDYIAFKERFPAHLIVYVSHASGSEPKGKSAVDVMYDASLKVWVEGYRAFSKGRFIGEKGYLDVWQEKAEVYWGRDL